LREVGVEIAVAVLVESVVRASAGDVGDLGTQLRVLELAIPPVDLINNCACTLNVRRSTWSQHVRGHAVENEPNIPSIPLTTLPTGAKPVPPTVSYAGLSIVLMKISFVRTRPPSSGLVQI
jgi:hypothetical protein